MCKRLSFLIVIATVVLLGAAPLLAQQPREVWIDPSQANTWTVDARIFGKFFEPNGRDAYPGLYAEHLSNSSLEQWYHHGSEVWQRRTSILFRDTELYSGLAYPWEPAGEDRPSFIEVDGDAPHGERFQQVLLINQARGGLKQKTALPHHRTLGYHLAFTARGSFVDTLEVRVTAHEGGLTLFEEKVPLTEEWRRDTLFVDLGSAVAPCYRAGGGACSPSGIYTVEFIGEGTNGLSTFDLDWVSLVPDDAVRGKYNPTTIDWLKQFNVVTMRWGGNWMSAYQWRDGIGPVEDRPVRRNLGWGGLEHNYLGTAEFLEFCELAGIVPQLNAPFNMDGNYPDIPPDEAAAWVEYVNGDTTTAMGRLRARHGHPEPWNVKLWQVGNETYGGYQHGHTDEVTYAHGIREYASRMKAVDSTITLIVAGVDPLYRDYGGGEPPTWNQTLIEIAGDLIDGIDIHRYQRAVRDDAKRNREWEPDEYLQTMVAFSTQYEDILEMLRRDATERGHPGMHIEVGEWEVGGNVSRGWPVMNYPRMVHAVGSAGMYNAFIRQGEVVRYTYHRDNTLYYRPFPIDFRPINPGQYTFEMYAELFDETETVWHHLPLRSEGPTFFMRQQGIRQQDTPDVPYVDVAGIVSEEGDEAYVFLVNRDLEQSRTARLHVDVGWHVEGGSVNVFRQASTSGPFEPQWAWATEPPFIDNRAFEMSEEQAAMQIDDGEEVVAVTMEPSSVARVAIPLTKATAVDEEARVAWSLRALYPSPARVGEAVRVEYGVERAGPVRLTLYDALGRRVRTMEAGVRARGVHRADLATEGLAAGTYYLRLQGGDGAAVHTRAVVLVQ